MKASGDQFDEILKAALNRAYGGQSAPPELRRRILADWAAGRAEDMGGPIRLSLWRRPLVRLAAAAAIILALAGLIYSVLPPLHRHAGIRHDVVLAMLERHDGVSKQPPTALARDKAAVAQAIGQQLRRPVLAPDLEKDGWRFEDGGMCQVRGRPSAHLVFSRGQQRLSIYSMDAAGCADAAQTARCEVVHNHVMASLVKGGSLYCAIGHCPAGTLKQDELKRILETHQSEIVEVAEAGAQ